MTWNHRVYRKDAGGETWFTIREAFYGDDKDTPHSWTADPIATAGETVEELRAELERMLLALDKPVLEDGD